jgi:adenylate kinase
MGLTHIATGDLLREELAAGTPLGVEAKRHMDAGELVPDAVVIGMVRERLANGASDVLFDGFPRTVPQAEALDAALAEIGAPVDRVLLLEVARDELARRLGGRWLCRRCGKSYHEIFAPYGDEPCRAKPEGPCDLYQRDDDRPEAVANRLDVYDTQTAPLVGYYESDGRLGRVAGEGSADEVYERIQAAIRAA